jgi:hypothetical protein
MQSAKVEAATAVLEAAEARGETPQRVKELVAQLAGERLKLRQASETKEAAVSLTTNGSGSTNCNPEVIAAKFHDVLAEHLDAAQGSQVTDKDIYRCAFEFRVLL